MRNQPEPSIHLDSLKMKLEAIWKILGTFSRDELQALAANPGLLGQVFGAPHKTDLSDLDANVLDCITGVDSFEPAFEPIVQVTRAQREEERRLHLEIWKKMGIENEMLLLAQLRGERVVPFAAQDNQLSAESGEQP